MSTNGVMPLTNWDKYRKVINKYAGTVSNQEVIWHRVVANLDRFGEGEGEQTVPIVLKALVAYNVFRTWPVDSRTLTGVIDKEYCHVYLNLEYLKEAGYLTADNQFDFNPGLDRFWINGLEYKPAGDTGASQANTSPLFQIIILEREAYPTSEDPRP